MLEISNNLIHESARGNAKKSPIPIDGDCPNVRALLNLPELS
jgi:hypothetical protein